MDEYDYTMDEYDYTVDEYGLFSLDDDDRVYSLDNVKHIERCVSYLSRAVFKKNVIYDDLKDIIINYVCSMFLHEKYKKVFFHAPHLYKKHFKETYSTIYVFEEYHVESLIPPKFRTNVFCGYCGNFMVKHILHRVPISITCRCDHKKLKTRKSYIFFNEFMMIPLKHNRQLYINPRFEYDNKKKYWRKL